VPDSNYKIVEECLHDLCNFVLDLHIFKRILLADAAKNVLFARLLQLAREKDFVENVVCFGKGEDNIKLAHIAIVFIHLFDVSVNNFEGDQLVIVGGAAGDEKERGISAVDDLSILVFEEVAHARSTSEHKLRYILDDLGLILGREG
jgi:hypothetical protein